jgi:hypothetical protein
LAVVAVLNAMSTLGATLHDSDEFVARAGSTSEAPDYHTNRAAIHRRLRNHIAQLTAVGFRVIVEPAA